jgi:hypothetical protein
VDDHRLTAVEFVACANASRGRAVVVTWRGSKTMSLTGVVRADKETAASTGSGGVREREEERRW